MEGSARGLPGPDELRQRKRQLDADRVAEETEALRREEANAQRRLEIQTLVAEFIDRVRELGVEPRRIEDSGGFGETIVWAECYAIGDSHYWPSYLAAPSLRYAVTTPTSRRATFKDRRDWRRRERKSGRWGTPGLEPREVAGDPIVTQHRYDDLSWVRPAERVPREISVGITIEPVMGAASWVTSEAVTALRKRLTERLVELTPSDDDDP
jgi:hypothetical protein